MKNKKMTREEKRRLLLYKKYERPADKQTNNASTGRVHFARPGSAMSVVRADGTATARTPISKRMLALILAVVFILTAVPTAAFFTLKGRADDADVGPATVHVRVENDDTNYGTVQIAPGNIAENVKDITINDLPENAEFIKAVIVDGEDETEIAAVGALDGTTYYSLRENSDIGTELKYGTIYLVYDTKYWISVANEDENKGTFVIDAHYDSDKSQYYAWSGEDVNIKKITPKAGFYADTVTFTAGNISDTLTIENSAVTIPADDIKGNIIIVSPFKAVSKYSITDASYEKNVGNGGITGTLGKSSISTTEESSYFKKRNFPEDVTPGTEETVFYLYSSSSTGRSQYILNMFSVNGVDFEEVYNLDDSSITKTIPDGSENGTEVTIEYYGTDMGLYWLDNNPTARGTLLSRHDRDFDWTTSGSTMTASSTPNKKRTIYKVTVKNIGTNLRVEYNFKQKNNSEVIIKGLRGITQTGHGKEEAGNGAYEYFLETAASNVYTAYYRQTLGVPSANLYLYRVETGYNPYTVSSRMYYVDDDENTWEYQENAVLSGEGAVGLPEEAIDNATAGVYSNGDSSWKKFNTSYRKWGGHSQQVVPIYNDDNTYDGIDFVTGGFFGNPFMLTSIGMDMTPTWYGLALQENAAKNQQLYLNANPYEFHLELDLDGGSLADTTGYSNSVSGHEGYWVETTSHTVENNSTLYLPEKDPSKDEAVFVGWQLQRWSSAKNEWVDVLDEDYYQRADAISIEKALGYVNGKEDDQYLRLRAVWETISESSDLTKVSVTIYKQVPDNYAGSTEKDGKWYILTHTTEEAQPKRQTAVLLNYYTPSPSDHYTMRSGTYENASGDTVKYTKLSTKTVAMASAADTIPEDNQLRIYWDYKTIDFSVEKVVKGKLSTSVYPITVTLTPDEAVDELDLAQAASMITLSNGKSMTIDTSNGVLTYTRNYYKGDKIEFSNVPYGWSYKVEEDTTGMGSDFDKVEYSPSSNGTGKLTNNTDVQVINRGTNPGIETEKSLIDNGDETYQIKLGSYATGDSYADELTRGIPTDFALVIDQSGSMASSDVGEKYVPTGNQGWKVSDVTDNTYYYYDSSDNEYHLVKKNTGTLYTLAYAKGTKSADSDLLRSSGRWFTHYRKNGGNYYIYDSDNEEFYYLFFRESGSEAALSYNTYFFYIKDTSYGSNTNDDSSVLEDAYTSGTNIGRITYGGYDSINYSRSGLGLGRVNTSSVTPSGATLDANLYTKGTGANELYYTNSAGTNISLGSVTGSDQIAYRGRLYTKRQVTRMEALQDSVKDFVGEIASNAYETGVDHRVAIIGFADNQMPGYWPSETVANTNGSNGKYDYQNTGIFLNQGFKNYETVSVSTSNPATTQYNNVDYYINASGTWVPVVYDSTEKYWYRCDTGDKVTPAWYDPDDTTCNWWYYNAYQNREYYMYDSYSDGYRYHSGYPLVYRFYEPTFTPLSSSDYQNALVSANQTNSASINADLTWAINNFKTQGSTYTSYGIAMANGVFANNDGTYTDSDGNTQKRNRVIVVFSDGAPGKDGYDSVIANEALADSAVSKSTDEYGATVYTVYLYGSSGKDSTAETFMQQLSSDYNIEKTNVYDLDPDKSYYYTDDECKTYSVTADKSEVYVWAQNGIGGYSYWTLSNKALYSDESLSTTVSSPTVGEYYWIDYNGTATQAYYGYKWYNSNGRIREPMTSEDDPDASASLYRHWQFFCVSEPESLGTSKYAYTASSATSLESIFETISTSMGMVTTAVELDGSNSFMRDIITDDFVLPKSGNSYDYSKIEVYQVPGRYDGSNYSFDESAKELLWNSSSSDNTYKPDIEEQEDGTTYVTVNNFEYSSKYIASGKDGYKLLVTIDRLELKEGHVGTLYSNTNQSGVYRINDDDSESLIADFPMPNPVQVDPLKADVKLSFSGTHAQDNQTFPVTFKLTMSDGTTPYSGKYGNYTFNSDGVYSTNMSNDSFERLFTGIPPKAKLTVTVTDSDDNVLNYTYQMKDIDADLTVDNTKTGEYQLTSSTVQGGEESAETREVEIIITDNRRLFTITNETQPLYEDEDYSDRTKEFPIKLTLYKNGDKVTTNSLTFLDTNGREVTFENGELVVGLANQKSKSFYVPDGYSIKVEDETDPAPYWTTFPAEDATGPVAIQDDNSYATATMSNADASVTIVHTIEAPVVTGIGEELSLPMMAVLGAVAALGLAAAGVYVYGRRRKRLTN